MISLLDLKRAALASHVATLPATQLRLYDSPIGPSELFAVIYVCLRLLTNGKDRYKKDYIKTVRTITLSYVAMQVCMMFGLLINLVTVNTFSPRFLLEMLSVDYAFIMAIIIINDSVNDAKSFKVVSLGFGIGVLIILTMIYMGFAWQFFELKLWYSGEGVDDIGSRFQGWSTNPNQIGIYLAAGMFLLLCQWKISSSVYEKMGFIIVFLVTILIVDATKSTTLFIVIGLLAIFYLFSMLSKPTLLRVGLVFLFLYLSVTYFIKSREEIFLLVNAEVVDKGQTGGMNGRFAIWQNSLMAILESPIFGYGPGAHSGYTGPHQGVESHSVFLDLMTQSGILGLMLYLWILFLILKFSGANKVSFIMMLPLISVIFYQFSHFSIRYPITWIALLSPLFFSMRHVKYAK